jgi:hypothetical protein
MFALIYRVLPISVVLALSGIGSASADGPLVHRPPIDINSNHPVVLYPGDPPPNLPPPQTVTPPYGLQIVYSTTTPHTSAYNPNGPAVVLSPSVIFNFPITPNIDGYLNSGLHYAYKAVGLEGAHLY